MDRNTITGLLLIGAILLTFFYMNNEQPEAGEDKENTEQVAQNDSIPQKDSVGADTAVIDQIDATSYNWDSTALAAIPVEVNTDSTLLTQYKDSVEADWEKRLEAINAEKEAAAGVEEFGIFFPASTGENKYYTIENDKLIVKLASKGGRIADVKLKEHQTWADYNESPETVEPMSLFDENTYKQSLRILTTDDNAIHTQSMYFEASTTDTLVDATSEAASISFRMNTNDPNTYLQFTYTLTPGKYDVDYQVEYVNLEGKVKLGETDLTWMMDGLSTEKLASDERMICTIMYRYFDENRDYLGERSDDQLEFEGPVNWVSFKHKYFSSVLMSENSFKKGDKIAQKQIDSPDRTVRYSADLSVAPQNVVDFKFFFGPNDQEILASYENELEGTINLGWGIFRWVNQIMIQPLFNMLKSTGMGYGLLIFLLTLFVKIIVTPLTYRNYKSSAKMRVLKPEIEKINEKYKDKPDPMKKQQETMALYRATGVNPMAGCVPMLIQMPILLAVFRFIPSSIHLRHEGFLWAEDLSSYDSILTLPFEIPLGYGDHVSLFALLMAVSTLFYTIMNSSQMNTNQPGMPNMKYIMYFFPVMMLFFFNSYSSGLSYYYLCGNLMNMGIMWGIKKYMIDEEKIKLQLAENKKKPKKKSKFQQRLEEMSKQQQQMKKKK